MTYEKIIDDFNKITDRFNLSSPAAMRLLGYGYCSISTIITREGEKEVFSEKLKVLEKKLTIEGYKQSSDTKKQKEPLYVRSCLKCDKKMIVISRFRRICEQCRGRGEYE